MKPLSKAILIVFCMLLVVVAVVLDSHAANASEEAGSPSRPAPVQPVPQPEMPEPPPDSPYEESCEDRGDCPVETCEDRGDCPEEYPDPDMLETAPAGHAEYGDGYVEEGPVVPEAENPPNDGISPYEPSAAGGPCGPEGCDSDSGDSGFEERIIFVIDGRESYVRIEGDRAPELYNIDCADYDYIVDYLFHYRDFGVVGAADCEDYVASRPIWLKVGIVILLVLFIIFLVANHMAHREIDRMERPEIKTENMFFG